MENRPPARKRKAKGQDGHLARALNERDGRRGRMSRNERRLELSAERVRTAWIAQKAAVSMLFADTPIHPLMESAENRAVHAIRPVRPYGGTAAPVSSAVPRGASPSGHKVAGTRKETQSPCKKSFSWLPRRGCGSASHGAL